MFDEGVPHLQTLPILFAFLGCVDDRYECIDDHDDLIFYVCICLDWMPACAADHDIDNVVIKTEIATTDDLHVDILDAVQQTHWWTFFPPS